MTILPTLQAPRQQLAQNQQGTPACSNTSPLRPWPPPPYRPPPTPPPPPPKTRGSFAPCFWPPQPPPKHWRKLVHRTLAQCNLTDEEEGRPRLRGRTPDPGHAEPARQQPHQRQPPPTLAQPGSLASHQTPTASQERDKPVRSQEHDHSPAPATAPLCLRPAKSHPR